MGLQPIAETGGSLNTEINHHIINSVSSALKAVSSHNIEADEAVVILATVDVIVFSICITACSSSRREVIGGAEILQLSSRNHSSLLA